MIETYTQSWMFILARSILVGIQAIMLMYLLRLSAEKGDAYVGAIDLRTHEMLDEVMIDFTRGDFNQIASIGVHDGQLYVEIQTELDHSDIHVLDLDEDE